MGMVTTATSTGVAVSRGAPTDALDESYLIFAQEALRVKVEPIPGNGPVRGLCYFKGVYYGFRDDTAMGVCRMYKASSNTVGWEEVMTGVNLLPGGRYEFKIYNFTGHTSTIMLYGVDGVNKGFKFDGTTFTQITTTMTIDTPKHLAAFKKHLFYSFSGGSVQHSSIGVPGTWSPVTGASQLAMGDEITGFKSTPKALFIYCRNRSLVLTGTSSANWVLDEISDEAGAIEWTIQRFNYPITLDDRGVASMDSVQEYGDFFVAKKSQKIQRLLASLKNTVIGSIKIKTKDQYRLYFENKSILTFTFNGDKLAGIAFSTYDVVVRVPASFESTTGEELLLFGDDNGYAYRMDSGYNFDGSEIDAWIRLVFYHFGYPEYNKRFFKTVLEIDAKQATEITFLPEFEYNSVELPTSNETANITVLGGGNWWDSPDAYWGTFYHDSQPISSAYGYTEGVGTNFSLFIRSVGTYVAPHTLQGAIIHYSLKGLKR